MAQKFLTGIEAYDGLDLKKTEIKNAAIQNLGTAPASPSTGQVYFNTGDGTLYIYNGTEWVSAGGDITGVLITAGSGMTGTVETTTGQHVQTINVIGGDGITANADEIEVTVDNTTIGLNAADGTGAVYIKNGGVGNNQLGSDAVDGTKIADNAIDSEHITAGSVDLGHLSADSVDGSKIADNSIDSEHYVDGSIDTEHLASQAVTSQKIGGGEVATINIADYNVTAIKLAADSVITSKIENGAIIDDKIALATISNDKLVDSGVASGTYGSDTQIPSVTVNQQGIVTNVTLNDISTDLDISDGTSSGTIALGTDTLTIQPGDGMQIALLSGTFGVAVDNTVVRTSGDQTITGLKTFSDSIVINGDLTVSGTTTTKLSETVLIEDNLITLNSNETGTPSENAGIEVNRGTENNVSIQWNESLDKWTMYDGALKYIASESYVDTSHSSKVFKQDIGDASHTGFIVTHNLGNLDVIVQVYKKSSGETVFCDVVRADVNTVTLDFATAPATDEYRVLIYSI